MNTVPTTSGKPDKINSIVRNHRTDKRKDSEVSTDQLSNQTSKINPKGTSSLSTAKNQSDENDLEKGKDKLKVNEYLKLVSRLENKLKMGELEESELEKISQSLEDSVLSLNDVQKNRLLKMAFFKKFNIDNIKDLKKTMFDLFKDVNEREELFEFLKNKEFISILLNETEKPSIYSAPTPININKLENKPV